MHRRMSLVVDDITLFVIEIPYNLGMREAGHPENRLRLTRENFIDLGQSYAVRLQEPLTPPCNRPVEQKRVIIRHEQSQFRLVIENICPHLSLFRLGNIRRIAEYHVVFPLVEFLLAIQNVHLQEIRFQCSGRLYIRCKILVRRHCKGIFGDIDACNLDAGY